MLKDLDDFFAERTESNQVVGAWGFGSNLNFSRMSSEETNVWFFEQVFNFLRAFFGLVAPDSMELITYEARKHIEKRNLDQQTFLDELMLAMKGLKEPLWTIRLNLTILGFLRTSHDPDRPVRIHIQEPTTFILWGGPDETGFQTFSIGYTLFSGMVLEGEHNILWSLNQPILEKGLRKWERQTGHAIEVVESNGNLPVYRYGFKKPAEARGSL